MNHQLYSRSRIVPLGMNLREGILTLNQSNEVCRNGQLRVILVEDNDNVRITLKLLLEHRGYEVLAFSKPTICPLQIQPACRCSENQSCTDVILTDFDMPEMDGIRFIENLRKKNCKCSHVAIMSGFLTREAIKQAEKLGCKIFEKPFEKEILFKWLDNIKRSIKTSRVLCNWFQDTNLSISD